MKPENDDLFPLSWEQVLWSSGPVFPLSIVRPGTQYVLTDYRLLVRSRGRIIGELMLDDVGTVRLNQRWSQRITGTSTVCVTSRRTTAALRLENIQQGPQLALILQLRAVDLVDDVRVLCSALGSDPPALLQPRTWLLGAATVVFAVMFGVIGVARRHDPLLPIVYASHDPIAPNGERRSQQEIVAFMEEEVMPFARRVLGPLAGGPDNVACETCHGADGGRRHWKMPGVRALPEPQFRGGGMERAGFWVDPQMRNAVYGYLADEDKQPVAGYMRRVVMPGMADKLHRPAYDFARSYRYNRSRAAVGCYHCHLVD